MKGINLNFGTMDDSAFEKLLESGNVPQPQAAPEEELPVGRQQLEQIAQADRMTSDERIFGKPTQSMGDRFDALSDDAYASVMEQLQQAQTPQDAYNALMSAVVEKPQEDESFTNVSDEDFEKIMDNHDRYQNSRPVEASPSQQWNAHIRQQASNRMWNSN